ncbi:hypothetical protein QFC20_003499 [Naganishia adeliensis]|uniref:Uncharacterized protein n=1 Tax=Naganishia adeliensis TaxID=92952 RepID=A0ACC2W9B9_9TREE|nr:hypothetical protein QFC20_003499 [Naganishia adeliensis]
MSRYNPFAKTKRSEEGVSRTETSSGIPYASSRPQPEEELKTDLGLEVGDQRYKLDGIAFCAKMSFGVPGSGSRVAGTPMGMPTVGTGDKESLVTGGGAQAEKEMAMREEGSYFTSTATQALPTTTVPTPSRPRRPLLRTQSSTIDNNPFTPGGSITAHAFETSDPDLCLSLESMKGRQTLRVRGVERLEDGEVLDAGEGGVHVYLDPGMGGPSSLSGNAHSVLAQYIFNSICRRKLSSSGRTRKVLVVTLGDDVIDASTSATFLIYGQVKHDAQPAEAGRPKLELLATRRKAATKPEVPGDALYTEDGFKVPTMLSSRTLRRSASAAIHAARMSRVRSQSTIYMPPPAAPTVSRLGLSRSSSATTIDEGGPPKTTLAPPVKKLTPGRRGEKRKRPLKQQMEEDEEKRRRAGKIVSDAGVGAVAAPENWVRSPSGSLNRVAVKAGASIPVAGQSNGGIPEIIAVDDEDIFGNVNRIEDVGANQAVTKPRSATKSECETKNKASIKKRLLTSMEARNCGRSHPEFKDVFSVANKGVSFALRHTIAKDPLDKEVIEKIVKAHLDLYLPEVEVIAVDDDETDLPPGITESPGLQTPIAVEPLGNVQSIDIHEGDPNTTMI